MALAQDEVIAQDLAVAMDLRHEVMAFDLMSLSTLEIGLTIGIAVALIVIVILVRMMQQSSAKIMKLENRTRGLQHSLMLDHQKAIKDAETAQALKSSLAKEREILRARNTEVTSLDSVTRAHMDEVLGR